MKKRFHLPVALLLLAACAYDGPAGAGPRVWIDKPQNGDAFESGPILVQSTASDKNGVSQFDLYVNDTLVRTDLNAQGSGILTHIEQPWLPSAPGAYRLIVRAKNLSGEQGSSVSVSVLVGVKPTATNTPTRPVSPQVITITPTFTPILQPPVVVTPPTPTATATTTRPIISVTPQPISPTHTRTFTPPPPPPPVCSGTSNIASFSASPTTISPGGSSTLSWGQVTNADSVFLGSDGVATPGSRVVAPTVSTTYTLTARCGANTQTRQVTVLVTTPISPSPTHTRTPTTPPDTSPPTITSISESADPIWYGTSGCSGAYGVTITANVSDPSGVAEVTIYYKRQGTATYLSKAMTATGGGNYTSGNIPSSQVAGSGSSDQFMEYYIQARDSRGNSANSSIRTVQMRYCFI